MLFDQTGPTSAAEEHCPSRVNDHVQQPGAGISASLPTGQVDWAVGESGGALPNGRHRRHFLLVHPADGAAGYFVTIDELTPDRPGATGLVVWHPAAEHCVATEPDTEYDVTVADFSQAGVGLTLYLATPPTTVSAHRGVMANADRGGIVGAYLVGHYATGDAAGTHGRRSVATVLFPHDAEHPKAALSRLDAPGVTGALIQQGDVVDCLFESIGGKVEPEPGVVVVARAGLYRRIIDGGHSLLWLTGATRFSAGDQDFRSTSPVTLVQRAGELRIRAELDTEVTVREPGIAGATLDGLPTNTRRITGQDALVLVVPAGEHTVGLISRSDP